MLDVRKAPTIYNLKSKIWRPRRPGFTLIELLVVIVIIGILASFAVASFTSAQAKGRDSRRKADLNAIKTALELYRSDQTAGTVPNAIYGGELTTPGYIKTMPTDPKWNANYIYLPNTGSSGNWKGYNLTACAENGKDPQTISYINCVLAGWNTHGKAFRVTNP